MIIHFIKWIRIIYSNVNCDYKKAVDNSLVKIFLEKYNLNKIPDHSINFVARLNTYASEGLLRVQETN